MENITYESFWVRDRKTYGMRKVREESQKMENITYESFWVREKYVKITDIDKFHVHRSRKTDKASVRRFEVREKSRRWVCDV